MEAKKQIWGVGENMGTEESKKIWEENAQFWDNAMGDESNEFHREVAKSKNALSVKVTYSSVRAVISDGPLYGRMNTKCAFKIIFTGYGATAT